MKPASLIVAALAAHRGAQAISVDKITEPFRQRVLLWSVADDQGPRQYEIRAKVNQLISCPHCTGFWFSGAAIAATMLAQRHRWLRPLIWWWAAASIQTMLTAGWATLASVAQAAETEHALNEHELRQRNLPN